MVTSLVILAGGDGKRLKQISGNTSKPLVKIGDKHVVTFVIEKMKKELNVSKIYLLIQEKHYGQYLDYLAAFSSRDIDVELVVETTKLGTGGAIKNFVQEYDEKKFYVTNADTIIKTDISIFKNAPINSILCTKLNKNLRFGSLKIDDQNNIISFEEKKTGEDVIVSTGVYKLHGSIFSSIKEDQFDIEKTIFPQMASQKKLKCFLTDVHFVDIGIPQDYLGEAKRVEHGG